jgi:hypothetical protein
VRFLLHFRTYTSKVEIPSTHELFKLAVNLMKACIGVQSPPGSAAEVPIAGNEAHISFSNFQNIRGKTHTYCFL